MKLVKERVKELVRGKLTGKIKQRDLNHGLKSVNPARDLGIAISSIDEPRGKGNFKMGAVEENMLFKKIQKSKIFVHTLAQRS